MSVIPRYHFELYEPMPLETVWVFMNASQTCSELDQDALIARVSIVYKQDDGKQFQRVFDLELGDELADWLILDGTVAKPTAFNVEQILRRNKEADGTNTRCQRTGNNVEVQLHVLKLTITEPLTVTSIIVEDTSLLRTDGNAYTEPVLDIAGIVVKERFPDAIEQLSPARTATQEPLCRVTDDLYNSQTIEPTMTTRLQLGDTPTLANTCGTRSPQTINNVPFSFIDRSYVTRPTSETLRMYERQEVSMRNVFSTVHIELRDLKIVQKLHLLLSVHQVCNLDSSNADGHVLGYVRLVFVDDDEEGSLVVEVPLIVGADDRFRGLLRYTSTPPCPMGSRRLGDSAQSIFSATGTKLREHTNSFALGNLRDWLVGTDGIIDRVGFDIEHLEVTIPASVVGKKLKRIELIDADTTGRDDNQISTISTQRELEQSLKDPFIVLHSVTLEIPSKE
ncbi:hypothetical protein HC928_00910 [bacterium]|nr:hypothetical protein [bacterium]